MIYTKLPYKVEDFDSISKDGAVVDISDPAFDGIDKSELNRTVLIYLRNTGFDVTLDFSNVELTDKFELLRLYISDSIENGDIHFKNTWLAILAKNAGFEKTELVDLILSEEEIDLFISENRNLVDTVCTVYASLPLYLLTRLKNSQCRTEDFEYDGSVKVGTNFVNILDDWLLSNINLNQKFKVVNFGKIFTIENNQLFDRLKKTVLGFVLYAASAP